MLTVTRVSETVVDVAWCERRARQPRLARIVRTGERNDACHPSMQPDDGSGACAVGVAGDDDRRPTRLLAVYEELPVPLRVDLLEMPEPAHDAALDAVRRFY